MNKYEEAYRLCLKKIEIHMEEFPKKEISEYGANTTGDFYKDSHVSSFFKQNNWLASCITGLAPLAYRTEKDPRYLKWANQFKEDYRKKVFDTPLETMHDIGFLYFPYSIAMYQITGDEDHKKSAIKAADELLKRFDINGRYIDAWARMDWRVQGHNREFGRMIVDCMMNVIILLWAWKMTGHEMYKSVAVAHIESTKKYLLRPDDSVIHSCIFDVETGKMLGESNTCGYADGSHWARGTSWAVYGFALAAKYLNNDEYYDISMRLAKKFISCLDEGQYTPIWDFRLPKDKPAIYCGKQPNDNTTWDITKYENRKFAVDASSVGIISGGMMELMDYGKHHDFDDYVDGGLAEVIDKYLNRDENLPAFIGYQNGSMTYTTYGDYFFLEALQRRIFNTPNCWSTF